VSRAIEAARALVAAARAACLATLDPASATPFASLVAVTDDGHGRPLMLLSGLSEHTRNLRAHPRASLLFTATLDGATMDVPRVTLSGTVRWLDGDDALAARARILTHHPDAAQYADLPGFTPARLDVEAVRAVGGFARAASLDPAAWSA
jgi:putative heme iron utilization protein